MPSLPTIARVGKALVGGGLITGIVRSPVVREIGRRTIADPQGLLREMADPAKARVLVGRASHDPALREAAQAGLLLLPFRYVPLGYAAMWVGGKAVGRFRRPKRAPGIPLRAGAPDRA